MTKTIKVIRAGMQYFDKYINLCLEELKKSLKYNNGKEFDRNKGLELKLVIREID